MKSGVGFGIVTFAVLAGCENAEVDQGTSSSDQSAIGISQDLPPEAPPGTCWDKIVGPAVTETVTEQVLVKPADLTDGGEVENPAVYRNEERLSVVREGDKTWFETPCNDVFTEEFVASLQRALAARKLYPGPISGKLNESTRSAIKSYQQAQGLSSNILSMASARSLGLVPYGV